MHHTPVLIVGGSLVGLSATLFLSWRGVPNIVIEKHRGSSPHPRAIGFTQRTLEYFRAAGIAQQIPEISPGLRLRRARVESLSGPRIAETEWTPGQEAQRDGTLSPCSGAAIAQDKLEPILCAAALERGSQLRLGVEMLSFHQDQNGVTVRVRDRESGAETELCADYLVAADGAGSPIREQLGLTRSGVGALRTLRSVLFHCPAADAYLESGFQQYEIKQPGFDAFMTTYGDSRWVLMFDDDQERTESELKEAVRRALGSPMAFEIITTGRWELAGRIADCYQAGRIFLAGDAAHQLPPTRGGYGANTGIDDAYNLAWKLQRVVQGLSAPALLETYNSERRPIGWLRHQQTFARPDYAAWAGGSLAGESIYSDEAMEFGQLLRSAAILGAGPELPPAAHPKDWAGQPGTRAAHLWVEKANRRISTLDLFTQHFTLITECPHWTAAAREAASSAAFAMEVLLVGRDLMFQTPDDFRSHYGVTHEGASLVRPDGIVCWRSSTLPMDPVERLRTVMKQVAMPRS